ncbi:MAG: response regulator [Ramlibacter sp.]|nr:response regulator [Ramlibacter sp.]
MPERVFIKVVGFTDVERHALNTVFRLSGERDAAYALWAPDAPSAPQLALIDGQSYEARLELALPSADPSLKMIWVGDAPPPSAWRSFSRPLLWPHVLHAVDTLFGVAEAPAVDLDLDLDFDAQGGPDTLPPEEVPTAARALLINPDGEERLYLRARLALAGVVFMDEASSVAEALAMMQSQPYAVVVADLAAPGMGGWQGAQQLQAAATPPASLLISTSLGGWRVRRQARKAGVQGLMHKPFDPTELADLLRKVERALAA